jgi:predicted regulator of Ras-like GTPase activity (Roadblock/LC7/MglB family)
MIDGLTNLAATAGVRGVLVFDQDDNCLASVLHPPYEPHFVVDAMRRLFSALDVFASLRDGTLSDVSLCCEGGGIVARCTEPHTIVALTEPKTNPNLLSVAMNVVVMNLQKLSGQQLSGQQRSAQARPVPAVPSRVGAARSGVLDSRSHASLSHLGSSRMLTTGGSSSEIEIPPDAIPRTRILLILDVYRQSMGPAAKVVFKQELESLGVTSRTLRQEQLGDFLKRLARHIPGLERQQQFIHAAQLAG